MKLLIPIFRPIIYSNLFVSLCAVAITHLTFLLLNLSPQKGVIPILTFIFCSTYFTYNLQRIVRLQNNKLSEKVIGKRLKWIKNNQLFLLITSIISGIISFVSLFYISIEGISIIIPSAILSTIYVLPTIPFKGKIIELRQFPFLKIFIVSIVWSLVTVALPYINYYGFNNLNNIDFILSMCKRFLFIFAITLPFDIRDLNFDNTSNIKTIPSLIGVRSTILLSEIILGLFIGLFFVQHHLQLLNTDQLIGLLASTIITMLIISRSSEKRSELFYSGLIESTMLLLYIGAIIF